MPTGAGQRVSGFLLMPAICLTLELRVSLSYTCCSLLPLLSSLGAEACLLGVSIFLSVCAEGWTG